MLQLGDELGLSAVLAEWRAQRPPLARPQLTAPGLSCDAYVHAGTLEVSHRAVRHRIAFGVGDPVGARRGEVRPWTKASRRRFRSALHRVQWERHSSAWCVATLTLPGADVEICMDGLRVRSWRRTFLMRLYRRHLAPGYVWKLEFQRRGAAHLAIAYSVTGGVDLEAERAWVARVWWEIVGSGSERHLRAGTSVEKVRSLRALSTYLIGEFVKGKSKEYQHVVPRTYKNVGRWWGFSRGLVEPWSVWRHDERQAYAVRRVLARCVRSQKGRRVVRRALRRRTGRIEVYLQPESVGLVVGWQLQGMRT